LPHHLQLSVHTSTMSLSFELKSNISSQLDTSVENHLAEMQNN